MGLARDGVLARNEVLCVVWLELSALAVGEGLVSGGRCISPDRW